MSHTLSRVLAAACVGALPAVVQAQQSATISGRVTNEAGAGLPAVSVFIPTLNFGTTTGADGSFSFSVPAARVTGQTVGVTARIVGFRSQTVQVTLRGGAITQNFTLVSAPTTLATVVVTGAGTVSTRERLGNVINSVDSTLVRRAVEPANVVSALAAKAPNVEVRTQSGEPGASASIRIRGTTGVVGSQDPLFVVDGQPIDNSTTSTNGGNQSTVSQNRASDINPNDVASVEILKGAAAAAIYGARAANGVVLITTKRGRAGQTRYSLQSTVTGDQIYDKDVLQQSFGLGSGGVTPACFGPTAPVDCAVALGASGAWGPAVSGPTFDQLGAIYTNGNTFDNQLQVTGGGDRTTFFFSGGQTRQSGVITGPNNFLNTTSVRLRASQQLLRDLNIEGNFNYVNKAGAQVQKGSNTSGLLLGALRTSPNFDNRYFIDSTSGLHRSFRYPRPGAGSETISRRYDNPFFTANNPANRNELGRFIGNLRTDYTPVQWLRVQYTLGADNYAEDRREGLPLTSSTRPDGQVLSLTQNNLEIDHNLTATATYEVNPDIKGNVTLGQNLNQRRFRQTFITGTTLVAPEPLNLQNTLSYVPTQFRSTRRIAAYFGQATADLYNQLFITGLVRQDGFSTFGASDRTAVFPAVSAAWTFSRFVKQRLGQSPDDQGLISFGKLRFGYGESGKEPPVYATFNALSVGQTAFGSGFGDFLNAGQGGLGALINGAQLGNNNLRPERSVEREYGIDLGFVDQRVNLGVTYYNKRTGDAILQVPINVAQTGSSTALRNAATISNKGLEVELNTIPLRGRNYEWNANFQFGRNRNRVESLAGADFITFNTEGFTGAIGSATVGFPVGTVRGNDFARCGRGLTIDGVGDIDALCGANAQENALFLGTDGLPVFDPTDRVIAVTQPDYTMGFNTALRYGNFTVTATMDYRHGGQVWNGTRGIMYYFGTHSDTDIRTQQGAYGRNWMTDKYPVVAGPGVDSVPFKTAADWQGWLQSDGGGFGNVGAQFIENASFFKLREVGVTYEATAPWVRRRLGLSAMQFRVSGRNLFLVSDYKGFDPEANLGGAEFITQGFDYFNNPMSRSAVLSVTLTR